MPEYTTLADAEIIAELEFAHYACERTVLEGADADRMAMYYRRRANLQEEAERRDILNEAELEAATERAQAAADP